MKIDKMLLEIVGATPLILHNGRLSNPLDPYTKRQKAITSKRNKTEEDIENLLILQWEASLYWHDDLGVYMPSENLQAAIYAAAKKHKLGVKTGGINLEDPIGYSILFKNSKNFEALKADEENKFVKMVTIQRSKTISCRPIFKEWRMNFVLEFDSSIVDANDIKTLLETLSTRIGFGVWRPGSPKPGPHGKFSISSMRWEAANGKVKEIKGVT